MRERSVLGVVLLTFITCGLYAIYWFVATKREMVERGADIPTAWLLVIPFVNIWWQWKWAGGVEHVTRGRMTQVTSFVLLFVLSLFGVGFIGMAVVQSALNEAIRHEPGQIPHARAIS
ncbi:MAG TPA: DUF4234 domain-containing protein [Kofleriaceae bacterium]|nr:DUF4234 domain-containing protein [Kofleriaceae bacterium]